MIAKRTLCCFILLIGATHAPSQQPTPIPAVINYAQQRLEKQPTFERRLGLAELRRAHGFDAAAREELAKLSVGDGNAVACELACWRMLPIVPAQRQAFRTQVVNLKRADANNAWIAVFELCLAAANTDRTALLSAIERMPASLPARFPGSAGEKAHLDLLRDLGTPRIQAGLDVIAARNHEPLHALRDLDRALSREADYLRSAARDTDAKNVIAGRDRLRKAYRAASEHLVERLFALHLLGETKVRDALLMRAKALPYLHDRQKLMSVLERTSEEQGWTKLVQPMLASELQLIEQPPDLAKLSSNQIAELQINADRKTASGKSISYEGNVRLRLRGVEVACRQLALHAGDDPANVLLMGSDDVELRGITGFPGGAFADRFTFHAETAAFTLAGAIRLHSFDKTLKLRSCTLTPGGDLRDARSLLDDYRALFTHDAKLEMLPKLSKVYADDELPPDIRYLLALEVLRPHLSWHAPYLPPTPDQFDRVEKIKALREDVKQSDGYFTPFREADRGEPWMSADVPAAAQDAFRESLRGWYRRFNENPRTKNTKLIDLPIPGIDLYFWRIRDLRHADIARATRLLSGIHTDELNAKASRWRDEIGRNNTVLTFDIAGAAAIDKPHRLLMDARNADQVKFKLYRVERSQELLFATKRIGVDFIYRDHGLSDLERMKTSEGLLKQRMRSMTDRAERMSKEDAFQPDWMPAQLVHQWDVRVADLKVHRGDREWRRHRYWDDDWYDETDAHYFDDACAAHRSRIDKDYRPQQEDELSSWQCDRIVEIPAGKLREAGAYVLIAESNGTNAHVPIVVDPLSLTLRRCRDGVFVMASDSTGKAPLAGATVHARGIRGDAKTDAQGVAFARVFAAGDRPIVVHHRGRYAVGGFGQVFEGIYSSPYDDEHHWLRDRMKRADGKHGEAKDVSASLYEDQHVIAAYTDRPTYRPGQDVQFKLIVRKLVADKNVATASDSFRGDEFDRTTKLALPDLERTLRYSITDPKGREIAHGSLAMSEFGTAAGSAALNAESVLGAYTFRVEIAGRWRIVPDVFAVKHYRRPNFEVLIDGIPEKLAKPQTLTVKIGSQYYFGPPLKGGSVELRITRKDLGKTVVETHEKLDANGHAKVEMRLPKTLDAGKYFAVCSVTDESGRTVTTTRPFTLTGPASTTANGLDALPRFIKVGEELRVATTAKAVHGDQKITSLRFETKDGIATLRFLAPGWYHLKAGNDEASLFVYGGKEHPRSYAGDRADGDEEEPNNCRPKWVNLSDFALEDNDHLSRWERPSEHLYVLFDRQSVAIDGKIRLLAYVPHKQAKMLFTMEGRTIVDYVLIDAQEIAGAYQIVELPIKERYYPNIYLQGRFVRHTPTAVRPEAEKMMEKLRKLIEVENEEIDPRWCRIDVRKPKGKQEAPSLNVRVETDRSDYRPGDTVRASVRVTDQDGKPKAAELSLAAVDESVFAFGEDGLDGFPAFFRTPHEVRRFQPSVWRTSVGNRWGKAQAQAMKDQIQAIEKMSSAMKALDAAGQLLQTLESSHRVQHLTAISPVRLPGEMPTGQIPLARLREHFQETAAWLPQLRTDETGTARVNFTLPDSLTRYRLTSVALTRTTEVGVGRARITAGLPLAVQVFVPRFATEGDRLQAVALIHNHADQARQCQYTWEVDDAILESAAPPTPDWKVLQDKGKYVGTGTVMVAAKSSAKVGVWLDLKQTGAARVTFRAIAGKDGDAEVRVLPVHALGKPGNVNVNEDLAAIPVNKPVAKEIAGKFNKEGRIRLPAGFHATEIHLSLACTDIAQALDGLDYLVDYPYGCIEQTMSRFLPVVMIKHATKNSPVRLRPDMEARLPDILQTGLTRLYGHQHGDGSWGWFEKDSRNLPMSVYVVYGLARCQTAGTKVDADVLRRGCDYVKEELRTNKHEPELVARAWHALALAGYADRKELTAQTKAMLTASQRGDVHANIALACRAAGLAELGEQAYLKTKQWQPQDTEGAALKLNAQVAFGATNQECRTSASVLLARRQGTQWYHTRDTSWAIEALSNLLGYIPEKNLIRRIEVTFGNKKVLEVTKADDLKRMIHQIHLRSPELPVSDGLEIRMHVDSDEPVHVAFRAVGVQRQDKVDASGGKVRMTRTLETLDGEVVRGALKIGQVVRVRLRLELTENERYLMVEDRRPTLCEFADDHLSGSAARSAVHQEFRDDRLCVFFASLPAGMHEIVYYLRAETAGQCSVMPGCAYPMYEEKHRGETASSKVEVKTP